MNVVEFLSVGIVPAIVAGEIFTIHLVYKWKRRKA